MKEYFNFSGVAKRQEFWAVQIITVVVLLFATVALAALGDAGMILLFPLVIAAFWIVLAVTVKRIRDAGLNTWWLLVVLIPYVGSVATIVFGCLKSADSAE